MTNEQIAKMAAVDKVLNEVRKECQRAVEKHGPMKSAHEGYAVLLEEVDELWTEIKQDTGYTPEAFAEAVQVAAMGVRYVADLRK
jgi:hypothetical protein